MSFRVGKAVRTTTPSRGTNRWGCSAGSIRGRKESGPEPEPEQASKERWCEIEAAQDGEVFGLSAAA